MGPEQQHEVRGQTAVQPLTRRTGHEKDAMATGKVRIFELAKELGISSKELIGLFERLGLEAKNQLAVVEPPIAELVRGVLLGGKAKVAKAAPAAATKAPAEVAKAKPVRKAAAKPVVEEPVPTLKPVTGTRRTAAKAAAAFADETPQAAPAAAEPDALAASAEKPKRAAKSGSPAPRLAPARAATTPKPRAPEAPDSSPIPQLRPVPAGRSTIAPRPPQEQAAGVAASATPRPSVDIPGRAG